jgi:hypothetical protein
MENNLLSYLHYYMGAEIVFKHKKGLIYAGTTMKLTPEVFKLIQEKQFTQQHFHLVARRLRDIQISEQLQVINMAWHPTNKEWIGACEYRPGTLLHGQKALYFLWRGQEFSLILDYHRVGVRLVTRNAKDEEVEVPVYNVFGIAHYLMERKFWIYGEAWFTEKIVVDPAYHKRIFR